MPYPAKAIANYFLDLAEQSGKQLTPMQIQKLVYLAHGWNLAIKGEPLIAERIEAWTYGPVIRNLYDEFKKNGSRPIKQRATEIDFAAEPWSSPVRARTPSIDDNPDVEQNRFTEDLLKRVWEMYGSFTAAQLS